mmetsp:Transcript_34455/g.75407  ORF Transcript_34455/g.75407 Transcript_34455/m.75407 type:complete len:634 (-) Transcript_34455:262-2163(-)
MEPHPLFSSKARAAVFLLFGANFLLTWFQLLSPSCAVQDRQGTSIGNVQAARRHHRVPNASKTGGTASGCSCSCGSRLQIVSGKDALAKALHYGRNDTYWDLVDFLRPNSVQVRIMNAEPDTDYSVMAVSAGRFSKPGDLVSITNDADSKLPQQVYHLEFPFAGEYSLLVHKTYPFTSDDRRKPSPLVPPSPRVSVNVAHDDCVLNNRREKKTGLLPCQAVQHDLLTEWNGEWLGPRERVSSNGRMRSGWSFMPMQCSLETFTTTDFVTISLSSSGKTSIAVLGDSTDRGVFLSLVDMALQPEEKLEFATSNIGKCWGRASVQINSALEIVYQDYRPKMIRSEEKPGTVTCHDEHIALASGYRENRTAMIKELMHQQNPPQVLLIQSGCRSKHFLSVSASSKIDKTGPPECMTLTREFCSLFPSDWNGTIYVSTPYLNGFVRETPKKDLEHYWYALRWFSDYINDKRVRIIDLYQLASGMRYNTESLDRIRRSQHQHRWCNETASGTQVCSNVTEALANLLIGRAVAPQGKHHWKQRQQAAGKHPVKQKVRICTDCPASLLPFHIKPKPDLTCTSGPLMHADKVGPVWNTPPCPSECLKTMPTGGAKTQSGMVDIRVCDLNSTKDNSSHFFQL